MDRMNDHMVFVCRTIGLGDVATGYLEERGLNDPQVVEYLDRDQFRRLESESRGRFHFGDYAALAKLQAWLGRYREDHRGALPSGRQGWLSELTATSFNLFDHHRVPTVSRGLNSTPWVGMRTDRSALCQPGNLVALYSPMHERLIRMDGESVDGYGVKRKQGSLPVPLMDSERFTVVDGGDGTISLHNPCHNRFLRLLEGAVNGGGGEKAAHELPPRDVWGAERFQVVDAGNGTAALYVPCEKRFLRMIHGGHIDGGVQDMPAESPPTDWLFERFHVLLVHRVKD